MGALRAAGITEMGATPVVAMVVTTGGVHGAVGPGSGMGPSITGIGAGNGAAGTGAGGGGG